MSSQEALAPPGSWESSARSALLGCCLFLGCCSPFRGLLSVSPPPRFISVLIRGSQRGWEQTIAEGAAKQNLSGTKTHQSWLGAKVVIAEFPRHYPDLRDYDLPPFAGSAGAGRSALGQSWHRLCARRRSPGGSLGTHPARVSWSLRDAAAADWGNAGSVCPALGAQAGHLSVPPSQVAGRWMLISSRLLERAPGLAETAHGRGLMLLFMRGLHEILGFTK